MSIFRPSYAGIGELLNAEFLQVEMHRRAEKVKARAVEIAPFDPKSTDGTHYKDAFSVDSGSHGGIHHDRAYGRVTNDDAAAVFVEFGVKEGVDKNGRKHGATPKHRTLGKALDAAKE